MRGKSRRECLVAISKCPQTIEAGGINRRAHPLLYLWIPFDQDPYRSTAVKIEGVVNCRLSYGPLPVWKSVGFCWGSETVTDLEPTTGAAKFRHLKASLAVCELSFMFETTEQKVPRIFGEPKRKYQVQKSRCYLVIR